MKSDLVTNLMFFYRLFTRCYPAKFTPDYLDEMAEVFQQRLYQAANKGAWQALLALLLEFVDLPGIAFRSLKMDLFAGRGGEMQPENEAVPQTNGVKMPAKHARQPTWAIIIGLIPFLVSPVLTILLQVLKPVATEWGQLSLRQAGDWAGFITLSTFLAVMLILIISWKKGFPVWSFPYWSLLAIWTLFMTMAATPGLSLFGIPLFGGEIWGIRAWVPLLLVLVMGISLTRSLRPLKELVSTLQRDWTSLSYLLYLPLPFILLVLFDEVKGEDLFVAGMQLVLAAGALGYLLSRNQRQRIAALIGGLVFSWLPSGFYLWNYWDGKVVQYLPEPIDGSSNLTGMIVSMLLFAIILGTPGILTLLFRHSQPHGGAKNPPAAV